MSTKGQLEFTRETRETRCERDGRDPNADMAKMVADPTPHQWWALCKPCQDSLVS